MTLMSPGARSLAGACPLWLATLLFLATLGQVLGALIPPLSPVPRRLLVGLGVASAILIVAAATLHDRALVWQTPVRGFALASLSVGAAYPLHAAFQNRTFLFSPAGAVCAGYVLAAARLMAYLQQTL